MSKQNIGALTVVAVPAPYLALASLVRILGHHSVVGGSLYEHCDRLLCSPSGAGCNLTATLVSSLVGVGRVSSPWGRDRTTHFAECDHSHLI